MNLENYFDALRRAHKGVLPLSIDQQRAVEHTYDRPLWIIAGPGTGKTHTLVWLALKRLLVDNIQPERMVLTTFTRKAAAELQSRLIQSRQQLIDAGAQEAQHVDISQISLGTLHGICSRLLQNHRYEPTLRIRVLEDELTQQFFLRRTDNPLVIDGSIALWQRFGMWDASKPYGPSRAKKADLASKLYNRLTENSISVDALVASGEPEFCELANGYRAYQQALAEEYRTDQAHLQAHFLAFLRTSEGQEWLQGGEEGEGLTVIVDEYQDTNPIQEQIYFALAHASRDLTVVGDDDQSLYRFRGATVESLIDFDRACNHYLSIEPAQVNLNENRRSHPAIVDWVNRYIELHRAMRDARVRVRAPNKRPLVALSPISGNYTAVMAVAEQPYRNAAAKVASIVQELYAARMLTDYSQVALLTFSTRETSRGIGEFTSALRAAGVPIYNPRNGKAHQDTLFLQMVGTLIGIVDSDGAGQPEFLPGGVPSYIQSARDAFAEIAGLPQYAALKRYVERSAEAVRRAPIGTDGHYSYLLRQGGRRVTISALLYKLLAHEPFATGMTEAEASARLKALNLILAEYESLYYDGELPLELAPDGSSRILQAALSNFYGVFVEGIHDRLNDPEDDEVSVQRGAVNVMTIHQSKGLEFEVVFVLRPDSQPWSSDTHIMEDELDQFIDRPTKAPVRRTREQRASEDAIRLFFVAYSRAKRLLVLVGGNNVDKWSPVLGYLPSGQLIDSRSALQSAGVRLL